MKNNRNRNKQRNRRRPAVGRNRAGRGRNTSRMASGAKFRKTSRPQVMGYKMTSNGLMHSMNVKHTEYVGSIEYQTSYTTSHTQILQVNPGLVSMFPWLADIANRFETYYFKHLRFTYKPESGTQTDGAITMAVDYDAADDNTDIGKAKLYSFEDTVRGTLWEQTALKCKPQNLRKMKEYFSRKGALASNLDIKTYDVAQLIIQLSHATVDTDVVLGDLWVDYEICLITPQLSEAQPFDLLNHYETYTPSEENAGPFPYPGSNTVLAGTNGLYPVSPGTGSLGYARELALGKTGRYMIKLLSVLDSDDAHSSPSAHIPEVFDYTPPYTHMETKFVDAEFSQLATNIYELSSTLMVWIKNNSDNLIDSKMPVYYWTGFSNTTSSLSEFDIYVQPITEAVYNTLGFPYYSKDNKDIPKNLKPGQKVTAAMLKLKDKVKDKVKEVLKPVHREPGDTIPGTPCGPSFLKTFYK